MRKSIRIMIMLCCILLASCTPVSEVSSTFQSEIPSSVMMVSPVATQTATPIATPSLKSTVVNIATVEFSTYDVKKKFYSDMGGYVELDLKLPKLTGTYAGIPAINEFFEDREKFFFDELPFDTLQVTEAVGKKIEGEGDGFYRQAYYYLEAKIGEILSVSAALDGGAGGVGWAGIEGDTFNLSTGAKLSLSDIFDADEDDYMNCIYEFVSKKAADDIEEAFKNGYGSPYFFDDAYTGNGYESIRAYDREDFYLTDSSLIVLYQKYVLAIGAAGPLEFEIPYEDIRDMLKFDVNAS